MVKKLLYLLCPSFSSKMPLPASSPVSSSLPRLLFPQMSSCSRVLSSKTVNFASSAAAHWRKFYCVPRQTIYFLWLYRSLCRSPCYFFSLCYFFPLMSWPVSWPFLILSRVVAYATAHVQFSRNTVYATAHFDESVSLVYFFYRFFAYLCTLNFFGQKSFKPYKIALLSSEIVDFGNNF